MFDCSKTLRVYEEFRDNQKERVMDILQLEAGRVLEDLEGWENMKHRERRTLDLLSRLRASTSLRYAAFVAMDLRGLCVS
jgi:hypothetical protein